MSSIPPPLGPTSSDEEKIEYLMITVDRLKSAHKLLSWAAATAIVFGLGSVAGVGGWLYSRGVSDESMRNGIESCRVEIHNSTEAVKTSVDIVRSSVQGVRDDLTETRSDVKELQRVAFPRRHDPRDRNDP